MYEPCSRDQSLYVSHSRSLGRTNALPTISHPGGPGGRGSRLRFDLKSIVAKSAAQTVRITGMIEPGNDLIAGVELLTIVDQTSLTGELQVVRTEMLASVIGENTIRSRFDLSPLDVVPRDSSEKGNAVAYLRL